MKKVFFLLAICGTIGFASSCTKHQCPAYGSAVKVQKQPIKVRA
ncbi:hypothetical protein ACFP1I_24925 [Dyadobacter subterraneus]|nr:hypothetical protein [Dyadobacter subterraneus]